jgi:hypothetical protein
MGPRMGIATDHEANNALRLNDDNLTPRTVRTRPDERRSERHCVRIRPLAVGRQDILLAGVKRLKADERKQDDLPGHLTGWSSTDKRMAASMLGYSPP